MLHTGKISKCLDVDAKQRQCGNPVTVFKGDEIRDCAVGFNKRVFCSVWASGPPRAFFFVKCLLWFSWLQHILTWKNQQFDTPRSGYKAVQKPYGRKPAIYIYIGKDRMVTERNIWGVEWSCSCVIVGFICIELHQIMQINCVYKHFLSMADVDISPFQKGV